MWGRLKGQVLRSQGERDADDDDTIISRALLRYYAPEVPSWLVTSGGAAQIMEHNEQLNYQKQYQQQFLRRDNVDRTHMFDRKDSVASVRTAAPSATPSPTPSAQLNSKASSSSKLADRLKRTKW